MSTDGAAHLALLTAAPDELSLLALLSSLASAIAARSLTITKAAVLTAAKEKRRNLGAGGWTKAHAVGLKGVLHAFRGAARVEAGGLEREYRTAATVASECVYCVYTCVRPARLISYVPPFLRPTLPTNLHRPLPSLSSYS